jgi:hypothetical protein
MGFGRVNMWCNQARKGKMKGRAEMKRKLIFTDWDGTRYYQDGRGDIVRANGDLCSITEEQNIRKELKMGGCYEEAI